MGHSADDYIGGAFGIGIIPIIFSGPSVLGFQVYHWLRDGYWTPLEFRLAWQWLGGHEPSFAWAGVQKIAVAILDGPLSGMMMVTALPLPFVLYAIASVIMSR